MASLLRVWRFDSPDLLEWLPLIALVLLIGLLWFFRNRGLRGGFVAAGYFVVALLPVIGLVRMAYLRSGTLVADHLQYFADVSLIALVCAGAMMLAKRERRELKTAIAVISILSIAVMGVCAWQRTRSFTTKNRFGETISRKIRTLGKRMRGLASIFFGRKNIPTNRTFATRGRIETGITGRITTWLVWLIVGRSNSTEESKIPREALRLEEAKLSTRQTASVATIRTNLANALTIVGNNLSNGAREIPAEAVATVMKKRLPSMKKRWSYEPNQPGIHRNLEMLLARLGRYDEAKAHLRATLQIVPNEPAGGETLQEIEAQHH